MKKPLKEKKKTRRKLVSNNIGPKSRLPPSVVRIRHHYLKIGVMRGWTRDRVSSLCNRLQCEVVELGELCCIKPKEMMSRWEMDRFTACQSLHFAIIESAMLFHLDGIETKPIVPINLLNTNEQTYTPQIGAGGTLNRLGSDSPEGQPEPQASPLDEPRHLGAGI